MELCEDLKTFNCKIHPNEHVQVVCADTKASNCLRCVECIMSHPNEKNKQSILSLNNFIANAWEHYQTVQSTLKIEDPIPNEIMEFLATEEETIIEFLRYIEKEKSRVKEVFGSFLQELTSFSREKRMKSFENLINNQT